MLPHELDKGGMDLTEPWDQPRVENLLTPCEIHRPSIDMESPPA
jgi:hypothetical protein